MANRKNAESMEVHELRKQSLKSLLALSGLALVMALVLAACGGDDPTPTPKPAAAEKAPVEEKKEEPKEKPKIVFSDLDWNSAQIQNAIARAIVEKGYGYETDAVFGGTIPLLEALSAGDTHVTMEIWLPNQQAAWEKTYQGGNGDVTILGKSLEDNWQSNWIIPQYTADANPGLKTVEDLKKPEYMELFVTPDSEGKARNLHCIPGWECEKINQQKVIAYGLQDVVHQINPGSNAALDAEIIGSFEKEEDILFYYWGPTSLSNRLNTKHGGYVVLEEPPYSEECANDPDETKAWACAYPLAEVFIAMRNDMIEAAPDVAEFLGKWDFNAGNALAADARAAEGDDFPEIASWWLANTTEWKDWVAPGIADKVLAAL